MQLVLEELFRYRVVLDLQEELNLLCHARLNATELADAKGLLPAAIFEGHQVLSETSARGATDVSLSASLAPTREWIHPIIDVRRGAAVVPRCTDAAATVASFRLSAVQYVPGDIVGVLHQAEGTTGPAGSEVTDEMEASPVAHTLPLQDLRLATPEPFHHDALLPTLEAIEPHHASKNVLDLCLGKLCGSVNKMGSSFHQKKKTAWRVTDEVTYLFYRARKRLAEQLARLKAGPTVTENLDSPWKLAIDLQTEDAALRELLGPSMSQGGLESLEETAILVDLSWKPEWGAAARVREWLSRSHSASPSISSHRPLQRVHWMVRGENSIRLRIPICAPALHSLYARYHRVPRETSAHCSTDFLVAVARLLLRYNGLCGGCMERESGWQAAVPPSVMDSFKGCFSQVRCTPPSSVTVECFASPLNATCDVFFSLFPDTDAAFGSLGNFFACHSVQACVETMTCASCAEPKVCTASSEGQSRAPAPSLSPSPLHRWLRLECNPPFDHEVVAAAFSHLLRWLRNDALCCALSILIVMPDSAQAHAREVRATVENSAFCRWVRSVAASECLYVHGAQQQHSLRHVKKKRRPSCKRSRDGRVKSVYFDANGHDASHLIQLSCPTRLIILQNDTAEQLITGTSIGETICASWRALSEGSSDAQH